MASRFQRVAKLAPLMSSYPRSAVNVGLSVRESPSIHLRRCRQSGQAGPIREPINVQWTAERSVVTVCQGEIHREQSTMLEVEMKFPVADFAPLDQRLADWGCRLDAPLHEIDSYFNAPERDFGQ